MTVTVAQNLAKKFTILFVMFLLVLCGIITIVSTSGLFVFRHVAMLLYAFEN